MIQGPWQTRRRRATLCGLLCLGLSLYGPLGVAQAPECYYLGNQAIGCDPEQTSGAGDDVTATTPTDPDYPTEDEQPPGDDDRNWLLPAIVVGVAALAAVNHHLQQERQQQDRNDAEGTDRRGLSR